MILPLVAALLDAPVLLLQRVQILLQLLALPVQGLLSFSGLCQRFGECGQHLLQFRQPLLACRFGGLQGLHLGPGADVLVELLQLRIQCLTLGPDRFQRAGRVELFMQLFQLCLQLLLQGGEFGQAALFVLGRQCVQIEFQPRQAGGLRGQD